MPSEQQETTQARMDFQSFMMDTSSGGELGAARTTFPIAAGAEALWAMVRQAGSKSGQILPAFNSGVHPVAEPGRFSSLYTATYGKGASKTRATVSPRPARSHKAPRAATVHGDPEIAKQQTPSPSDIANDRGGPLGQEKSWQEQEMQRGQIDPGAKVRRNPKCSVSRRWIRAADGDRLPNAVIVPEGTFLHREPDVQRQPVFRQASKRGSAAISCRSRSFSWWKRPQDPQASATRASNASCCYRAWRGNRQQVGKWFRILSGCHRC